MQERSAGWENRWEQGGSTVVRKLSCVAPRAGGIASRDGDRETEGVMVVVSLTLQCLPMAPAFMQAHAPMHSPFLALAQKA